MTTIPTFWGSRFIVSGDSTASASSIAALADGGFAVGFQTAIGAEFNVGGRVFNEFGSVFGPNVLDATSNTTAADRLAPELVQLANGTLAATFVREFNPTDFDPAAVFGNHPRYVTGPFDAYLDPSSRDDPLLFETERSGDGFATMYGSSLPAGTDELFIGRFDANGFAIGTVIDVDPTAEDQRDGDFDVLANGGFVATWSTFDGVANQLWLGLFDANGTAITGRFGFAFTPNAAFPQVAALTGGGFAVVWQDVNDGGIYHQLFDNRGFTIGARTFVPAGFSILPKIEALSDGGYIIGWSDFNATEGDGSPDGNITLQRYSAAGTPVGGQLGITLAGDQNLEDIEELSDGRVALTFTSETGDSTDVTRLLGQIIDPRDPTIAGTAGADVIVGREDDSAVFGEGGNDRLTGRDGDDSLSGGGGDDQLTGGTGDDQLGGGGGIDRLEGQAGDDTLDGGGGNDRLFGSNGDDLLRGGSGNDAMRGDAGNDVLVGGSGNDVLTGGAAADRLRGGDGSDRFEFVATADSGTQVGLQDIILDFQQVLDTIGLSAIDAVAGGADDAFAFIGAAAFSAAGQVRFVQQNGDTYVQLNVAGTDGAESIVRLEGLYTLGAGDFAL